METKCNRVPVQRAHSLIEFLLGDGTRPGWLDEQSHHQFGKVALRRPGDPADDVERQAAKNTGRSVWQSDGTESESGPMFGRSQSNRATGVVGFKSGSRSTFKF